MAQQTFTSGTAARALAGKDEGAKAAAQRAIQSFAQRGLIEPVETKGTGRTATRFFSASDIVRAAVMRELTALSIADNDVLTLVKGVDFDPAIMGCQRGESWAFEAILYRALGSQEPKLVVGIFGRQAPPDFEGMYPSACITIPLKGIVMKLLGSASRCSVN